MGVSSCARTFANTANTCTYTNTSVLPFAFFNRSILADPNRRQAYQHHQKRFTSSSNPFFHPYLDCNTKPVHILFHRVPCDHHHHHHQPHLLPPQSCHYFAVFPLPLLLFTLFLLLLMFAYTSPHTLPNTLKIHFDTCTHSLTLTFHSHSLCKSVTTHFLTQVTLPCTFLVHVFI